MSNEQKYQFHGGPLDGRTIDGPDKGMGRNPNYLLPADNGLAVIRADKGDQIIGRAIRTGSPIALYFLKGEFTAGQITYAWIEGAALNLHEAPGTLGGNVLFVSEGEPVTAEEFVKSLRDDLKSDAGHIDTKTFSDGAK